MRIASTRIILGIVCTILTMQTAWAQFTYELWLGSSTDDKIARYAYNELKYTPAQFLGYFMSDDTNDNALVSCPGNGELDAMAVGPDGKIYVAHGNTAYDGRFTIACYERDGTPAGTDPESLGDPEELITKTGFGINLRYWQPIKHMLVATNYIYVAGQSYVSYWRNHVFRHNLDGSYAGTNGTDARFTPEMDTGGQLTFFLAMNSTGVLHFCKANGELYSVDTNGNTNLVIDTTTSTAYRMCFDTNDRFYVSGSGGGMTACKNWRYAWNGTNYVGDGVVGPATNAVFFGQYNLPGVLTKYYFGYPDFLAIGPEDGYLYLMNRYGPNIWAGGGGSWLNQVHRMETSGANDGKHVIADGTPFIHGGDPSLGPWVTNGNAFTRMDMDIMFVKVPPIPAKGSVITVR